MRDALTVLVALILVGLVTQAAGLAQTQDSAASAKQYYQNAVTAIAKNDWQTAKAELLQAEKRAPGNALVHYDLALAYSHTGEIKSAQAELNKALQLGLPAEQKQVMEQLRLRLAASAKSSTLDEVPKEEAPGQLGAKATSSEVEHSPAEIKAWIVSNSETLARNRQAARGEHYVFVTSSIGVADPNDNCSVLVRTTRYNEVQGQGVPAEAVDYFEYTILARMLDPNKIDISAEALPYLTLYTLVLNTTNKLPVLHGRYGHVFGADDGSLLDKVKSEAEEVADSKTHLYFSDQDLANKMKKAFGDLIRQCGGKESVGNIY